MCRCVVYYPAAVYIEIMKVKLRKIMKFPSYFNDNVDSFFLEVNSFNVGFVNHVITYNLNLPNSKC